MDTKMMVRMRVAMPGGDVTVFEAAPAIEISTIQARRLYDAERALNDLTDLRVHIDLLPTGAAVTEGA